MPAESASPKRFVFTCQINGRYETHTAKAMSLDQDEPNAQYNPYEIPDLVATEEIELACIERGIPLTDLTDDSIKKHKFYLNCRDHLERPDIEIGYCSGNKAHHIYVEWKCDGGFHGRPICEKELRKKGVQI